jgi:Kef-type K+ transport system membrane component KefB/CBS domain-containing protein
MAMTEQITHLVAETSLWQSNILLLVGLAIFGGTVGARIFKRLKFPQVVGYIAIGIIVGDHVLGLISRQQVEGMGQFNYFALGIIGFMIGGELRWDVFKKYGRQLITILITEGLGPFLVVGISTFAVTYGATGNVQLAGILALILGAIASATAPAATVSVLWEYKTRGVLTTAVLAIIALDDGLSLLLYGFSSSVAGIIQGNGQGWLMTLALGPLREIGGAIALGAAGGWVLSLIAKRTREEAITLAFTVGLILLVVGVAQAVGADVILAAMVLGLMVANLVPRRSQETFDLIKGFASPIYVLFFVLVGAHLTLTNMPVWILVLAVTYSLARAGGKIFGTWIGAAWAKAPRTVQKYLGMCMFCQGGVAVGLALIAVHRFSKPVGGVVPGEIVVVVIIATTFVMELIGPPLVKLGVKKAGEIGLDVTEEDLIRSYTVADVMDQQPAVLPESCPAGQILRTFSERDSSCYPVTNAQGLLTGMITITEVKEAFASRQFQDWLLAYDLMEPVHDKTTPDVPLQDALERMRQFKLDYLPVVAGPDDDKLVGLIEQRSVNRALTEEIIRRQSIADNSHRD